MIKKISPQKIIIIGAGIAGLAACNRLIELGFGAQILEARNYCSGHIVTDHTLGIPFGRGAAWIHGDDNNPITQLAENYNSNKVIVDPRKFLTLNMPASLAKAM